MYVCLLAKCTHQLMEYFNCGDHPLQLELERPEGVVGVVVADVAPLGTITARSGVRVQLYIAIGHIGGHCSKEIHAIHNYHTKKHSISMNLVELTFESFRLFLEVHIER